MRLTAGAGGDRQVAGGAGAGLRLRGRGDLRVARTVIAAIGVESAATRRASRRSNAIRHLRSATIPQAFAETDAQVLVGGDTADNVDYIDAMNAWLPTVFVFVLGLSFILLTIAFRSIVVPRRRSC